jgi:hypothetical protein
MIFRSSRLRSRRSGFHQQAVHDGEHHRHHLRHFGRLLRRRRSPVFRELDAESNASDGHGGVAIFRQLDRRCFVPRHQPHEPPRVGGWDFDSESQSGKKLHRLRVDEKLCDFTNF